MKESTSRWILSEGGSIINRVKTISVFILHIFISLWRGLVYDIKSLPIRTSWRRILADLNSVTIRTKILGIVALGFVVSVATILAVGWYSYQGTNAILRNQLRQRGVVIGTTLAMYAGDVVLSENQSSLNRLVTDILESDKEVAYIIFQDANGVIVAQNFDESFPAESLGKNQVLPGEPYHIQVFQSQLGTVLDVAVPIPADKAGTVRVGLSEDSIQATVFAGLRQMLFWSALIFVLWFIIAFDLSSILIRPVYRLLEATRVVGGNDSRWRNVIEAKKDEISRLGATFGVMRRELQRREEMRQQLLNKVINAQEEERKRIARELHDQTGQSLISLIVGLKVLEAHSSAETKKEIIDLKQLATTTLTEIHNMALELRPSSLDDLGLVAALRHYTKEYASKFGVETEFQAVGLDDKRLPPMKETALYRIIQEALTNIVKHAAATKVNVSIESRDASIVAIVEDNGKGFDVDGVFTSGKTENRLGLYGMQERASVIGGTLTIESSWKGTTVFVEVSFEEKKEME